MTVIAYKEGVLACDSLWTDYGFKATYATKISKLPNGFLYATSGSNDDRELKKLISRMRPKDLTVDDFPSVRTLKETELTNATAMVIFNEKIFIVNIDLEDEEGEGVGVYEITLPFYAIGCGKELAMGAMAAGASATEAAEIACTYDPNCQGPIHTLTK
jgi:hypothetical protein